jgi:hypothetical protein
MVTIKFTFTQRFYAWKDICMNATVGSQNKDAILSSSHSVGEIYGTSSPSYVSLMASLFYRSTGDIRRVASSSLKPISRL